MNVGGEKFSTERKGDVMEPNIERELEEKFECLGEIKDAIGVTINEGKKIGDVTSVFIDVPSARLSAISFKSGRFANEHYVDIKDVEKIGEDVVFVRSITNLNPITDDDSPIGKSLKDIVGCWVTTQGGAHLGKLEDFDVRTTDWSISELRLTGNEVISVTGNEISIGEDEIIVPEDYESQIHSHHDKKMGIFKRFSNSMKEEFTSPDRESKEKMEPRQTQ